MEIFLVTITILVCLIGSYLIGNILFAQVISKVYFKKNIRSEGSKNPGATNLVRITKNRYIGILASFLDAAKGYVSILIGSYTLGLLLKKTNMEYLDPFILFCGTFSVLGHCFPIMYVIKYCKGVRGDELKQVSGGKGVSTYGGTVFSISPYIGLISLSTWIVIILITRYVSVSSIIACFTCAGLIWVKPLQNEYLFSYSNVLVYIFLILLLGAILILVRHIPNIKKLMNGIENKAFSKK